MTTQTPADPTRVKNFLAMSAVLTGFPASTLAPGFDPNNLKTLFLQTADANAGQPLVDQLLNQFLLLQGQKLPDQQIADTLLGVTESPLNSQTALLARSIIKLWYVGSWYPLGSQSADDGKVVSMLAYTGGLVWRTAQAHPMGYSEFKFGYWAQQPPSLAQFVDPSSPTTSNTAQDSEAHHG